MIGQSTLWKKRREFLIKYLNNFYAKYPGEKHTIFHFVKHFKTRLKMNKDAWCGVSGETGTGKSYFVIMSQILFGRPFNLEKNVTYIPTGDEILKKFKKLNFNTLLIDEAAMEMRAVNWQSKQQQGVNTAAMTERFKNNWVFLNMPNFLEFTKSMRRSNLQFRVIIPYRTNDYARVIVQRKSRNWRSDDPWEDKKADELYNKLTKRSDEIDNETLLKIERGLSTTIMDFIVPNLAVVLPKVAEEYEWRKLESRRIAADKGIGNKNIFKERYDNLLKKAALILKYNTLQLGHRRLTQKVMAEALGVSVDKFSKISRK